jgi:ribosomal protein S24E
MSFNIEILEQKRNPLIDRLELKVRISHFNKGSPNRLDIKKKVAEMKKADDKLTLIKKIKSHFGSTEDIGTIYIYDNSNELDYYEPFHLKVRNLTKEKRTEIYNLKKKNEPYKHLLYK